MGPPTSTERLVLRAYRGPEDHPAMNAAAAAARAHNGDRELGSVADMDNHYGHLDQAALPRDCAIVELGGLPVAYGRASWQELATGEARIDVIIYVHPDVRALGAADLLISHALGRASELIADRGAGRLGRVTAFVAGRHPEQQAALVARGFRRVRLDAQLIRTTLDDIPDLPIPAPFEIRPIDPDDQAMHRRVWEADARAFENSYGQEAASEAAFDEFLHQPTFDPSLWRVAFDGDRIAGQILSYRGQPEADGTWVGWTEAISVQPEYRRRGLARALLAESLRAVRDAGAGSAGLSVDTQNPNQALTLYESLGFRIVSKSFEYELGPSASGEAPLPFAERER